VNRLRSKHFKKVHFGSLQHDRHFSKPLILPSARKIKGFRKMAKVLLYVLQ